MLRKTTTKQLQPICLTQKARAVLRRAFARETTSSPEMYAAAARNWGEPGRLRRVLSKLLRGTCLIGGFHSPTVSAGPGQVDECGRRVLSGACMTVQEPASLQNASRHHAAGTVE